MSLLIAQGYTPYIDVFDNKPPIIYFAAYGGSWWLLWSIINITTSLSAAYFYITCQRYKFACSFACSIIYAILLRYPALTETGGTSYALSAAIIMIGVCYALSEKPSGFYLGLLSSLVFFTQTNDILAFAPFVIYAFVHNRSEHQSIISNFCKQSSLFIIGFLLPTIIICGYFYYRHAFNQFIYETFIFNFKVYIPHHRTVLAIINDFFSLASSTNILPFLLVIPANLLLLVHNKTKSTRLLSLVFLAAIILDIVNITLSGNPWGHYFLSFVVYLSFYIAISCTNIASIWRKDYLEKTVSGLLVVFIFWFAHTQRHCISRFTHFIKHPTAPTAYEAYMAPYENLIMDVKGQAGQLYVYRSYGFSFNLYTDLKIKSPSPWVYQMFWQWRPNWDKNHQIFMSIINDINQHKTKYIFDGTESDNLAGPMPIANNILWQNLLAEHYTKQTRVCWDMRGDTRLCGWLYVRN